MQVLTTALPPPTGGDRPHVVPVPRLRAAPRAGLGDPRQAYRIRPEWQVRAQDERRSACKCLPRRLAPHLDPHRCVPKMSVDQIKAKFRYQQTVRRKQQLASAAGSVRPSTCCGRRGGRGTQGARQAAAQGEVARGHAAPHRAFKRSPPGRQATDPWRPLVHVHDAVNADVRREWTLGILEIDHSLFS